jgi:hypothetical protein
MSAHDPKRTKGEEKELGKDHSTAVYLPSRVTPAAPAPVAIDQY